MDIDNETDGHGGTDMDLEQSLLQQFSCLGTTDKEELVKQLQKLIGSQLNETTASFFLDMNNWLVFKHFTSVYDLIHYNALGTCKQRFVHTSISMHHINFHQWH